MFSTPRSLSRKPAAAGQLHLDAASDLRAYLSASLCGGLPRRSTTGLDVLVEKPLAVTLAEADSLIAVRQELPDAYFAGGPPGALQPGRDRRRRPSINGPMFFEAHRLSVFHRRALDVDVVLDLMIHDLDIVLSFARSPVQQLHAVGLRILSPKVDIANVRLEFVSGCVANFTASRVSTETVRKLRFFQPHQYLSIDYARQDLLVINVAPGEGPDPASQANLVASKPVVQKGEPLRLEIEAFLEAVRTRKTTAHPRRRSPRCLGPGTRDQPGDRGTCWQGGSALGRRRTHGIFCSLYPSGTFNSN